MQHIYGSPPPSPEDHYEVIEDKQKIIQVMQTQVYNLEGLEQAKAVFARSNFTVMGQLA